MCGERLLATPEVDGEVRTRARGRAAIELTGLVRRPFLSLLRRRGLAVAALFVER